MLTAYSLVSAPMKLKTCSCTSWHAFSRPSLHLSSPPFLSSSLFQTFFSGLDQKHIVTKPYRAPRRDKDWILRVTTNMLHMHSHTHTHFLLISKKKNNNQPPLLKTGYFSDLSYCQNPPSQPSFMQERQQYKSWQPQSIWMYIHCHFRPWDVAFWLLPAKSRFKAMIPWVKWQTNPFCSVRPVEG